MANTTNYSMASIPRKRHTIATGSDLIIIAKESSLHGRGNKVVCVHEWEVSKEAMSKNQYFNKVSFSNSFADTGKDFYEVIDDDPVALEIWLRLFHDGLDKTTNMEASISNVWNLLVLAQKYNFDGHHPELRDWFSAWYEENFEKHDSISELTCQELLYPCYYFDHAPSFAAITKHLAYNMNTHIREEMPEGVDPIHKDHHIKNNRVIGSLNGARGSLRSGLHLRLYKPCIGLLNGMTRCVIKEKVFYQYHKALEQTRAWPFETEGYKRSISELLRLLGNFKYQDPHPDSGYPRHCSEDPNFSAIVNRTIECVNKQFDGLCLDCMYCSGSRDEDEEYWKHHVDGIWGNKCRIKHGQSSWYFSFLGRKDKMDEYQKRLRRTHMQT